jgi:hypothetical protein
MVFVTTVACTCVSNAAPNSARHNLFISAANQRSTIGQDGFSNMAPFATLIVLVLVLVLEVGQG